MGVFIVFILVLIAFLYFGGFLEIKNASKIKGIQGELKVAKTLWRLDESKYRVLNNIYLAANGGITQIDHVIVSIYGIFVIETKNYKGWIHGSQNSEQWALTYYREKIKFRNPIKQNNGHIFMIKKVLSRFKNIRYHSIIVFVGEAELKNTHTTTPVLSINQLLPTILENQRQNLTFEQVDKIQKIIIECNIKDRDRERRLVRSVKKHVALKRKKIEILVCPNCGGDLVERKGQYGKFYGCSNFPKCKFSKSLN